MHNTTLPLGRYAKDPRIEIVQVEGRDAIRAAGHTIIQRSNGSFEVWPLLDPSAIFAEHAARALGSCLSYVLGEPAKVGPVGMGSWLHTDGRIYAHDPATTAMVRAASLRIGDVVDFPNAAAFEVTGGEEVLIDWLGQHYTAYPVKPLRGGLNEHFRYEPSSMVPVRTGRRR